MKNDSQFMKPTEDQSNIGYDVIVAAFVNKWL